MAPGLSSAPLPGWASYTRRGGGGRGHCRPRVLEDSLSLSHGGSCRGTLYRSWVRPSDSWGSDRYQGMGLMNWSLNEAFCSCPTFNKYVA